MNRLFTLLAVLLLSVPLQGQTLTDFEDFGLGTGDFLNDALNGEFTTGNIRLPNFYDANYDFWSGWAISATTDTETPGFMNQYSSITGGGFDGSSTYAVTYAPDGTIIDLENEAEGGYVEGLYVTNSTYAYLSMLEGDGFAKRFGGETGDDPDFFLLTIHAEFQDELSSDSVNLYLADYRFANNEEDYILDEWVYLDLSPLGNADRLVFTLTSTDTSSFGFNTPAYFCIDNLTTADRPVSTQDARLEIDLSIFPNPISSTTQVNWPLEQEGRARIFDLQGQLMEELTLSYGSNPIDLSAYPSGAYVLRYSTSSGWNSRRLLKI